MKKLSRLLVCFILFISLLSASACTFVDNGGTNDGASDDSNVPYSNVSENSTSYTLKNSVELAAGITFSKVEHTAANKYSDSELDVLIETTHIDRSVVTLYCEYGSYKSVGSGVIIDVDDGVNFGEDENNIFYIITCHHVIDSMSGYDDNKITAYLADNEGDCYDDYDYDKKYEFTGYIGGAVATAKTQAVSLVGGDKTSDIAILRLYVSDEAVAGNIVKSKVTSRDYSLKQGTSVFAIGNPQGDHAGNLAYGKISDAKVKANVEEVGEMSLVGIDLNTQPGSSGGGLFNMYGELVGITNSGDAFEISGQSIGYGLNCAIPNKTDEDSSADKGFVNVAAQLIATYNAAEYNYGYVSGRRVLFGFTLAETTGGVTVSSVTNGGLASAAGLRANDVIKTIQLNSGVIANVSSISDIDGVLSASVIGDTIKLGIERRRAGSTTVTLTVSTFYFCNTGTYTGVTV